MPKIIGITVDQALSTHHGRLWNLLMLDLFRGQLQSLTGIRHRLTVTPALMIPVVTLIWGWR